MRRISWQTGNGEIFRRLPKFQGGFHVETTQFNGIPSSPGTANIGVGLANTFNVYGYKPILTATMYYRYGYDAFNKNLFLCEWDTPVKMNGDNLGCMPYDDDNDDPVEGYFSTYVGPTDATLGTTYLIDFWQTEPMNQRTFQIIIRSGGTSHPNTSDMVLVGQGQFNNYGITSLSKFTKLQTFKFVMAPRVTDEPSNTTFFNFNFAQTTGYNSYAIGFERAYNEDMDDVCIQIRALSTDGVDSYESSVNTNVWHSRLLAFIVDDNVDNAQIPAIPAIEESITEINDAIDDIQEELEGLPDEIEEAVSTAVEEATAEIMSSQASQFVAR